MTSLRRLALVASLALASCATATANLQTARPAAPATRCISAHDGDTIAVVVDGHRESVRLIGIDTAELAQPGPWGELARQYTAQLIGHPVRLETDTRTRDRYGRLLAYVYSAEGLFVNVELVRAGLAVAYRHPPDLAHAAAIDAAQREAQEAHRGLWADPTFQDPAAFRREHR